VRRKAKYGVTAGIAAASLGVAMMVATIQPAQAAGVMAPGGTFVALGDSYAAGNLIPASPAGTPAGCLRSTHNYSGDVQAVIRASRYVDVACSDATTADMTRPQHTVAGTNRPQFDALSPRDSLVTITIGGNDVGFRSILATCVALSATSPSGHPCKRHFTAGGTDRLAAAVRAVAPRIAAVLRGIHHRAPRARVLLAGYPGILPSTGTGCWPDVPLAHGDVPYLRATEQALNRVLARAAAANGATFVDTYRATIGHDVCQRPGTRWVEGLVPASPAYPFHPNRRGQQAIARQVLAALGR